MQILIVELLQQVDRFSFHRNHGVDFALPQLLQGDAWFDIKKMRLDAEALEHSHRGDESSAVRQVDRDRFAVEILKIADRLRGKDVHFLVVELGNVAKLPLDVVGIAFLLEVIEGIGSHDADVDALEEQNVSHRLDRSSSNDRQQSKIAAVVEHRGKIGPDLQLRT